jgi:ribosome biogenesis GTPase / thiamine phosphate phosphatase
MIKARVYKSTGSWYVVQTQAGAMLKARILGKFKNEGLKSTNPIAVGDWVMIVEEHEIEQTYSIVEILKRDNYITRTSPANKNQHHIIASNLDQSLLFATLRDPKTSNGFIDRFLISSEAFHIKTIIVFNKADLHRAKEEAIFEQNKAIYESIGYTVCRTSVEKNEGVAEVLAMLHNKTTLISGHSGVGKSSFLNAVFPNLSLRTTDVSSWSGKGMHTTTFAEMFNVPGGGTIIDTPGIRELGLVDMDRRELSHYFPEMRAELNNCQFNNCMHIDEKKCAIKDAVNAGAIAVERYASYLTILDTLVNKKY